MSDLRHRARDASRGGESILKQLHRIRDRILDPQIHMVRLFCDEKDGRFRPGAVEWLDRIAKKNFVRGTTFVAGDPEQTLINEGRRVAVMEILEDVLLDNERLEEINQQIREIEHGR